MKERFAKFYRLPRPQDSEIDIYNSVARNEWMKKTEQKKPIKRSRIDSSGVHNREHIAVLVRYEPSPYHSPYPASPQSPGKRKHKTSRCSQNLATIDELSGWLRESIKLGCFSAETKGEFPCYVWCRREGIVYKGELTNETQGWYSGHPLEPNEWPEGIDQYYPEET